MLLLKATLFTCTSLIVLQSGCVHSAKEELLSSTASPSSKTANRSNRSKERLKGPLYPATKLIVSRNSALFQRVSQPKGGFKPVKGWKFRLESSTEWAAITPNSGIIYISNPKALHSYKQDSENLTVSVYKAANESESFLHWIEIELDRNETQCGNDSENETLCAEFSTRETCRKGCGVSTSSFCSWRSAQIALNATSNFTQIYATCTPDIVFCPNRVCDELEEMDFHICPQDCTEYVYGSGMLNDGERGDRGINAASGVCFCNSFGKCTCSNEKSSAASFRSQKSDVTRGSLARDKPKENSSSGCDRTCMVFLSGCVVLLLVILLAATVYTKRLVHFARIILTRREALLEPKESSLCEWGAAQTIENAGAGATCDEQETKLYCVPNVKYLPLDPKWEFPRERLHIEKVVGEGEFGRVLQASAIDLPGVPGRTMVAVKALKNGAGSNELNDLLTEYELLKEVSHPNIIRLLGACTCTGGPIFIIIEYADRGSLRGYLRGCRRGGREALEAERLSLKTLISFAWQISKGMEYLSEMKMVHRDLAARNILLTSKGVCKVSDFGLSRDVYEDDTYLKQSRGKVPVKWMALESLSEQVYTSKSDVWSYGVLIWELLTLGLAPYPGIAIQSLFDLLRAGYRMENPVPNSNCKLYHLMQACWEVHPVRRPSFKHITSILNTILQEGSDYLDITTDIVINQEYMHIQPDGLDVEC
ncbi:proto-oncogene tyrosine-protein kinase receptor Ret isoform X2 [Neocloeon triangulifer]|uniref:proto-oncogene tyrosine-protein kinase receptor Ret isoform X2 n=1 Tax=Neocloeon triangulifer TaxID=2078957 RepID=UPI00286ECE60|nr:proto-oncogene tyrosine-protein kinase receptor Ret isoform X2 [Neocloeon triangulifer]